MQQMPSILSLESMNVVGVGGVMVRGRVTATLFGGIRTAVANKSV